MLHRPGGSVLQGVPFVMFIRSGSTFPYSRYHIRSRGCTGGHGRRKWRLYGLFSYKSDLGERDLAFGWGSRRACDRRRSVSLLALVLCVFDTAKSSPQRGDRASSSNSSCSDDRGKERPTIISLGHSGLDRYFLTQTEGRRSGIPDQVRDDVPDGWE